MDNIEKLRSLTKIKLIIMSISTITPILVIILFAVVFDIIDNSVFNEQPWVPYVLALIFEGYLVFKNVKYIRILINDEFANKVLIKKSDERNKFIEQKTANLASKIFIYILSIYTIYSAFMRTGYFIPAVSILIVFIIVQMIVKLVYTKKY